MAFITDTNDVRDPDVLGERIQDLLCEHFLNSNRKGAQNGVSKIKLEWPETVDGEERWFHAEIHVFGAEDVTEELADLEAEWRERQQEYADYDEQGLDHMEDRFGGELP